MRQLSVTECALAQGGTHEELISTEVIVALAIAGLAGLVLMIGPCRCFGLVLQM